VSTASRASLEQGTAIAIRGLSVAYGGSLALDGIELDIQRRAISGLIGPNGAGKTTLLRAIVGMLKPRAGQVRVLGQPIDAVRQRVAYVPQREQVDWQFPVSVLDVVLMGRYGRLGLGRRPTARDRLLALEALEALEMSAYASRQISELSGGQQQRVFLARALVQEAEVLLLDEPFNGIDSTTQLLIFDLLEQLRDAGATVLLSTHDLHAVEQRCDGMIALNRRVIACGPTPKVFVPEVLQATYGSRATTLHMGESAVLIYDR
jgi:manganese/zinc/iron transport system ATP- binding protein